MAAIAVTRIGQGPEVVLVHGGSGPNTTWHSLRPLATRWTLVHVYRRGYPPSPAGPHDFDTDAADLTPLLGSRPHLVAHSYGALGALIAAAAVPSNVRSLSLIEPPLFHLVSDDPDVDRLEQIGNAVLTHGLEADPARLREFLRIAGAPRVPIGSLPARLARSIQRAHGGRHPGEARPQLRVLREAGVPCLVISGGHSRALEAICDALELHAERVALAGAGHFAQSAPVFNELLTRHMASAE